MSAENYQEQSQESQPTGSAAAPRTSDLYRTNNIPDRFENPGPNPGNPVFSCESRPEALWFPQQNEQDVFQGYNNKPQHIMYITTNMKYGSKGPSVHTVPTSFHCKSQKFSEHLGKCEMYKNEGLNTSMDKSVV